MYDVRCTTYAVQRTTYIRIILLIAMGVLAPRPHLQDLGARTPINMRSNHADQYYKLQSAKFAE